jgi:pimeloyl-ACP methyl ester carboxylesterase
MLSSFGLRDSLPGTRNDPPSRTGPEHARVWAPHGQNGVGPGRHKANRSNLACHGDRIHWPWAPQGQNPSGAERRRSLRQWARGVGRRPRRGPWSYPQSCPQYYRGLSTGKNADQGCGAEGLYQSIFTDAGQTRTLAESRPLTVPVLTVDAFTTSFTEQTFRQVATGRVTSVRLREAGHLVAQEAPGALAAAVLEFVERVDNG